jgi:hypothetical protein
MMKPRFKRLLALVICTTFVLVFAPGETLALDNGLALTPPMGWNSWNTFGLKINEDLVKGVADVMVAKGFKDAGYQYILIDDGWQVKRDGQGNILANRDKFPSGIKALADYVHSDPAGTAAQSRTRRAFSLRTTSALPRSSTVRWAWSLMLARATGTILTCSKWAMAN